MGSLFYRQSSQTSIHDDTLVGITVGYQEKDLQNSVRKGGGVWDKEQKLRFLKYGKAVEPGPAERIVQTDKAISI
jgi:hypothetical protein